MPEFTTTGAKSIFCDMGDDFNNMCVTLQSCLAAYSGESFTEVSQFLKGVEDMCSNLYATL
eukprot:10372542-Ditylum_brightwellii.AAC.1